MAPFGVSSFPIEARMSCCDSLPTRLYGSPTYLERLLPLERNKVNSIRRSRTFAVTGSGKNLKNWIACFDRTRGTRQGRSDCCGYNVDGNATPEKLTAISFQLFLVVEPAMNYSRISMP